MFVQFSCSSFHTLREECITSYVFKRRYRRCIFYNLAKKLQAKMQKSSFPLPSGRGGEEVMSLYLAGLKGNLLIMWKRCCIWLMKSSHEKLEEYSVEVVFYCFSAGSSKTPDHCCTWRCGFTWYGRIVSVH